MGLSKLHLDKNNAKLAGVCAGLAEYWQVNVSWIRAGAVVGVIFLTKITLAAYLVACLVLDDKTPQQASDSNKDRYDNGKYDKYRRYLDESD